MASYSFCLMLFAVISVQLSTGQTKNFFTEGWDHNNQDEWHKEYPDCGGSYQSPIDLQDICSQDTTTIVQDDLYLTFWNYHRPILRSFLTLTNNGHTAQVDLRGSHKINYWAPRISGSAVNNHVYQFVQLHFHWDPKGTHGSEHAVHGSKEALEMHHVHFNTKYETFDEAKQYPDGVVVLATLFRADVIENPIFDPLSDLLNDVIQAESVVNFQRSLALLSLIPRKTFQTFYTYQGSLTTPPCSESVTWIIFTQVLSIGYSQLYQFQQLQNGNKIPFDTKRKLQALNGRIVRASSNRHCRPRYHDST